MRSLALAAMAGPADNPEERTGLLAAARSGDLTAFECLMRQHERLVLVTALRLAGNLPDAQDVSQEVFLKLYRNLEKLASEDLVASWLYRVTVNACHDLRRRRKRPEDLVEDAGRLVSGGADPHQAFAESERSRVLNLSLRMLPEKERAALVLRDLEGLSTEEVARALGSSEATVRSQVSKARVKVKGFVGRYFGRRL
jgi:RNA polymerase sigma-70 factor, ECF subfamily